MQQQDLKKEIEELKEMVKTLSEKVNKNTLRDLIPQEELEKLEKIKNETKELIEKSKIKENPLSAAIVAGIAGFLIGKIFCGDKHE
jgi:DNA-binding transcriptional regulator GbsR (MarR family)